MEDQNHWNARTAAAGTLAFHPGFDQFESIKIHGKFPHGEYEFGNP
jgi:hypothetical protein